MEALTEGTYPFAREERKPQVVRRSQLQVQMDILGCIGAGAGKPTQIMYRANLSWTALKGHLEILEKNGLLKEVDFGARKVYELTSKAVSVMSAYNQVLETMGTPPTVAPRSSPSGPFAPTELANTEGVRRPEMQCW